MINSNMLNMVLVILKFYFLIFHFILRKFSNIKLDIYDPLKNFEHVRSVELYDPLMKV